jgi:hypothetical protein
MEHLDDMLLSPEHLENLMFYSIIPTRSNVRDAALYHGLHIWTYNNIKKGKTIPVTGHGGP